MPAVAAIDVGSNATRLSTVAVTSTGIAESEVFQRYALRLGADVFARGVVSMTRQKALLEVFTDIAARLQKSGIRAYRAVATSAMREAANGASVLRQVYQQTGIQVEIITGAEESRLARNALVRALGTVDNDALLLDLGGGSLEIGRAGRGRGRSLPLGTVRLLERFPECNAPMGSQALVQLRQAVLAEVRRCIRNPRPAGLAIGTGGNLDAISKLLGTPGAPLPTVIMTDLEPFAHAVAGMTNEERGRVYGVRPDRADLILPAVLILLALTELFGLQSLVVPGTGLREAILYDLVTPTEAGQKARRLLGQGHDHAATAERSARLGRELFADLAAVHGLWPTALQPFLTALYAWYFGAFLRADAAVRHAVYVLEQVDGLDLDPRSRAVAAYAVRSLRSAAPEPWEGHTDDGRAAQVLAGLLRLTIAMAPQGRRTTALHVDLLTEPLQIAADLSAPLGPEVLGPLEQALGRRIVVR